MLLLDLFGDCKGLCLDYFDQLSEVFKLWKFEFEQLKLSEFELFSLLALSTFGVVLSLSSAVHISAIKTRESNSEELVTQAMLGASHRVTTRAVSRTTEQRLPLFIGGEHWWRRNADVQQAELGQALL